MSGGGTGKEESILERAERLGLEGMGDEYRAICGLVEEKGGMYAHRKWDERNRYKDVGCWDESRVVLKEAVVTEDGEDCDYVHASWVEGPHGPREFICTQGPLDNTVEEFWHMIWEQRVATIVMLCLCQETGKEKCCLYWPIGAEEKRMDLGYRIRLIARQTIHLGDYQLIKSQLELVKPGETPRGLYHVVQVNWPDRGLPPSPLPMASFVSLVQALHETMANLNGHKPTEVPKLIHCSAGVGRTGTYVLVDIALNDSAHSLPFHLTRLRRQRRHAVQTIHQYIFVYAVLIATKTNPQQSPPILNAINACLAKVT